MERPLLVVTAMAAIAAFASTTPAAAATLTLPGGTTVTYPQAPTLGGGGTGSLTGTVQPPGAGAAAAPFSCTYDAVAGTLVGSPVCAQLLGGTATGGLPLSQLENQIVGLRQSAGLALQAEGNLQLFNGLIDQRVGIDVVQQAQAEMQAGGRSTAFGDPSTGTWAYVGGSFVNDDRLGLEKSGHNITATAAVDHRSGDFLIGALAGYQGSDIDLKSLNGNLDSSGWLLGGYGTYVLSPVFSLTASGSYAHSNVHLTRTFAGAAVTSRNGHNEWSLGLTGAGFWKLSDSLGFTVLAGVDHGAWHNNAYVDSRGLSYGAESNDNTWGRLGSVLTLFTGGAVRPYVNASYGRLLSDAVFVAKRDTLTIGGGLAIVGEKMSGGLGVNTLLLQSGQKDTTIELSIRFSL